jgi:PEP-CTERM motif
MTIAYNPRTYKTVGIVDSSSHGNRGGGVKLNGINFGLIEAIDNIVYDNAPVTVPEPASIALLGTGLFGLGRARRGKRRRDRS